VKKNLPPASFQNRLCHLTTKNKSLSRLSQVDFNAPRKTECLLGARLDRRPRNLKWRMQKPKKRKNGNVQSFVANPDEQAKAIIDRKQAEWEQRRIQ
jgi:hypothetical protein